MAKIPFPLAAAEVRAHAARHRERWGATPYHPGSCPVCGADTVFFCHDLALAREVMTCAECNTTSRYRSLARGLLRAIRDLTGVQAPDLASLAKVPLSRRISVYDTQVPFHYSVCSYPLPELLEAAGWIDVHTSRYDPAQPWGTELGPGSTNQDLERLTFGDEAFDAVVTSDVMDHVRNVDRAHAEIARVLRPGGVYLFTVPHRRNAPTLERVRVHDPDDESKDELLMEPEYRGDGNSDSGRVLSYRVFGTDLDDDLARVGLPLEFTNDDDLAAGIVNTELFYCRKA